jgi:RNA polymerase sigma factor (TIGR02999 family)
MRPPEPASPSPNDDSTIKRFVVEHYDELHDYAKRQIAMETPGQTWEATGLLHEAVVEILNPERKSPVNDAQHFLAKAKLIMKHILTDRARHKQTEIAGGKHRRREMPFDIEDEKKPTGGFLIFQEELRKLASQDPEAAYLVELRCRGYSIADAAKKMNLSRSAAYDLWKFGRAWLMKEFDDSGSESGAS